MDFLGIFFGAIDDYKFTNNNANINNAYPYVLVLATRNDDFGKIYGFATALNTSNYQISAVYNYTNYARVNSFDFEKIQNPSDIILSYERNKQNSKYIYYDVLVNDIYLAKINPIYNDTINKIPTNAVLKITEIFDDGKGKNETGQSDYIKFDAKIFNPYRFK